MKSRLTKVIARINPRRMVDAAARKWASTHKRAVADLPLFDADWYLHEYPDVKRAGINPLDHYLFSGWREGRNPGPDFDTNWYLWKYADVRVSGLNPLVHYVTVGRRQNRKKLVAGHWTMGKVEESRRGLRKYANQILAQPAGIRKAGSVDFVALADQPSNLSNTTVRAIAFYLPQFHPIPENDSWWGRGFTEWTNVSKAVPQFVGHYQPHLPGELGFYDLRIVDVMRRQAELARHYGIYGFCFHHYWFGGKRLLERPVNQFLSERIDLPFCLCWANENWSRRWDGGESEILIAQNHSAEDDLAFIRDIEPALLDDRYIKIDGKPLLIVYRPRLLPDSRATADRWRSYWSKQGNGELYVVAARTFDDDIDPHTYGFDAGVEFPPHRSHVQKRNGSMRFINPNFAGHVFNYEDLAKQHCSFEYPDFRVFRCVAPGWDNTARKPLAGYVFRGSSPAAYARWLETAAQKTMMNTPSERILFINAWNEWAEGAHLEPDRRYGYAYLQATADVLGSRVIA